MHQNMHTGSVPTDMNHGGHELFDVHEALSGVIASLNQAMLLRPYVQDPELLDIIDRQYRFTLDEYNITVECFKSGTDPSHPTGSYKMKEGNDFIYGMKPSQPKKPLQNANEVNDEIISGFLLGSAKANATMKAATSLETTNPVVRRVLADSIPNCIEMAYELSIYQNKHHYYQVPQLAQQDMQQLLNAFAPSQGQPSMPDHTIQ
ncbi:spore coat protein [Sporosarcina sp. Sa2YVA2]|uniref:Spore coat protein n=2 Tax=Sporosarcina quadrami TaxID=2762234 RepID=A0ABR8UE39_9BACL|nr:spore coat protein [Sporosarcina quadrami]